MDRVNRGRVGKHYNSTRQYALGQLAAEDSDEHDGTGQYTLAQLVAEDNDDDPWPSSSNDERSTKQLEYTGPPLGVIYILYDRTSGHVKIGFSIAGADKRLSAAKSCDGRQKTSLIFETEANVPEGTLRRLERLIHWDLKHYQQVRDCPCGKGGAIRKHQEWFDVSREVARSTVAMWHRYVQGEPHEDDRRLMKLDSKLGEFDHMNPSRSKTHWQRLQHWYIVLFGEDYSKPAYDQDFDGAEDGNRGPARVWLSRDDDDLGYRSDEPPSKYISPRRRPTHDSKSAHRRTSEPPRRQIDKQKVLDMIREAKVSVQHSSSRKVLAELFRKVQEMR